MTRKRFLLGGLSAAAFCCGCRTLKGSAQRLPYGDTLGDRLWMWGHHPDSLDAAADAGEKYNLPRGRRIDMARACREMRIPGCCVVRWRNLPRAAELPAYMRQFRETKRLAFSITDSAAETFDEKVRLGLHYADLYPNMTTFYMDDYFSHDYAQPLEKLRAVKEALAARGMRLSVVLYSDSNGVREAYGPVLDLCDEVSFWFWHGKNTSSIETSVARLRRLVGPAKPILVGQYMWDFGGRKPMPGARMEQQLSSVHRLLRTGDISGLIFHCTPLVDLGLDAVKVSRDWIAAHAHEKIG